MKDTTRTAITAILAADESIDPALAREALALLDRGREAEVRVVPHAEAARRLGVTDRTLRNWVASGRLRAVYGTEAAHRSVGISAESLRLAVNG